MPLEPTEDLEQVAVDHGEVLLHVVEVFGVADTRHHVLALGVDQEVAVRLVLAGRRIAGEADARARVVVAVAEHHGLHVDGSAELVIDLLPNPVRDRAGPVPALEHRFDGTVELIARLLRERLARGLQDDGLVVLAQLAQGLGRDLVVELDAGVLLGGVERLVERLTVDTEDDAAVHGDEATVRVVREPCVVRDVGEALHAQVVQTEVEDGVHHSRHRELGSRAHADEQRIERVAELAAHGRLELEDVLRDLFVEPVGPAGVHVVAARIGRNREPRWHRKSQHARHLGEVRPLSTQQVLVLHRRAAVLVIEGVDVWHVDRV